MNKRFDWTPEALATLHRLYPDHTSAHVAQVLGTSLGAAYHKAWSLGLGKSAAFYASQSSGRIERGQQMPSIVATRFKPGSTPWNKGKPFNPGGRSTETRFKAGEMRGAAQHNYVPIGSHRISKDGYLERKVTDDPALVPTRRWTAVHRLVWIAANGPIPAGHIVCFLPGRKTNVLAEITADRLECISRAENIRRNSPSNKHPELAKLVQLKGQITRQVNRITREAAEQNKGAQA